mgnify:CR=1 FL=1
MKTKSKALLLTLCAVLLVAASVLGTMAYLTSTDTVTNTFTVGKVEIKLDETDVTNPTGSRVQANSYKLMPGTTYTKDPTVTVKAGSEESYVRMKVTFNNAAALMEMLPSADNLEDFTPDEIALIKKVAPILFLTNYTKVDSVWLPEYAMLGMEKTLADPNYFVYDAANDTVTYIFYYPTTVTATTADVTLPALFDTIKVPEHVTGEQLAKLNNFKITVVAEAIQAGSFDNAADAWSHF